MLESLDAFDLFTLVHFYSIVPNNRTAANKRIGGEKYPKLVIV